jgi:hypothetical protein
LREEFDEFCAVERLQPVEMAGDIAAFVRLQRSDRVPFEREIGERGLLGQRLLHIVFTERLLPEPGQRANRLGGLGLADGEKAGRLRSTRGGAGRGDAFQHGTVG